MFPGTAAGLEQYLIWNGCLDVAGFAAYAFSHTITLALSSNGEESQHAAAPTQNELESLATPGPDTGLDADGERSCAQQA